MRDRMGFSLRLAIGTVIAAALAVLILKYGDSYVPEASPSRLYQPGNGAWAAGLVWWFMAGAAIGLSGSLIAIRAAFRPSLLSITTIFLGVAISGVYLAGSALASAKELTLQNILLLGFIDAMFFLVPAFMPGFFAMLFGNLIIATGEGIFSRRSAVEIMPAELRREHEAHKAESREKAKV